MANAGATPALDFVGSPANYKSRCGAAVAVYGRAAAILSTHAKFSDVLHLYRDRFLKQSAISQIGGSSMRQEKFWFAMSGMLAVLAMALMLPVGAAAASKYKILYRFKGSPDGYASVGLIFDEVGNLYGTTAAGGNSGCQFNSGCGTVFKLKPNSDGTWRETVLYRFAGAPDGANPYSGPIFDNSGNLYGTTEEGGNPGCLYHNGCGTVFKLSPQADGSWKESVLYSFCSLTNCADGGGAYAGLTFDNAGNLYGATASGGTHFGGVLFKLTPNSNGGWTESVLYNFCSVKNCFDGGNVYSALIFDKTGNLYGTAVGGGNDTCDGSSCGVVFKFTPSLDGSWKEHVLHRFTGCKDGAAPFAGLTLDPTGNLYGATEQGGLANCFLPGNGVVFKIDTAGHFGVLHAFQGHPSANPNFGMAFDAAGNLYGTTANGIRPSYGTVFKLVPQSNGQWVYSVLHAFEDKPAGETFGNVILDSAGNVYGNAECSDVTICHGVVFEITP
jgi:uncharacterized repeat protein (TIGR03803 family)